MITYKRESHLRSLIKAISWRIIATTDTIFIVLLITCLAGNCSVDSAVKIGFFEFIFKLIIYYFHERIWQKTIKKGFVTTKDILFKTITWRIIATTTTFIISGTVLNAFDEIALLIALIELITKLALYYFHERIWLRLPLGKIRRMLFKKV